MQLRPLLAAGFICFVACLTSPCRAVAQEEIKPANGRVVGGDPTDIKYHPWQAALRITKGTSTYVCGGSIVADRWVLTAAHCLDKKSSPRDVRAKAGVTDFVAKGSWVEIERLIIHEGYNPGTHEHDIALIRLRAPPQGKIIPLARSDHALQPGTPLEVTGWGATSEGGQSSRVLRKASVPYLSRDACNAPAAYNGAILAGMMCAGRADGGVDGCQGDSGGPLVWHTQDGPVLVGVVSWGEGCARKLRYGVYTEVSKYQDWIVQAMAKTPR